MTHIPKIHHEFSEGLHIQKAIREQTHKTQNYLKMGFRDDIC